MKLSRRQLLTTSLSIAAIALFSLGRKVIEPLRAQYLAKKESHIETLQFIETHKGALSRIEIGGTLCVEYLQSIIPEITPEQVVHILKELGIKQLRFSMRWNKCVDATSKIDLSYYQPWLEALTAAGIEITLSCGPIKSPRYPEAHIPPHIMAFLKFTSSLEARQTGITFDQLYQQFEPAFIDSLPLAIAQLIREQGFLPPVGQTIGLESPLALFALEYLDQFLPHLKQLLGANFKQIVMFNPENEFRNPFGDGKYLMNLEYIHAVCQKIIDAKPDAAFLLNSAGISYNEQTVFTEVSSLEQSARAAEYLRKFFPDTPFTVGIDIYEEQEFTSELPFLKLFPDTISGMAILHQTGVIKYVLASLVKLGINFEATELQFERWGSMLRQYPPGSLYHLQYMLLRYIKTFLGDTKQLVRLWGLEEFLKRYLADPQNPQVQLLIMLIATINELSSQRTATS